ncbi:hypothetical protein [Aquabacter cavernae]|uniref:hypothetical protein n=1 Tax=Aquabacter cavernae TaxID=2496029 RepID=UPI0013DF1A89|nr:hypothetical protein [Aquabacter cavernae]
MLAQSRPTSTARLHSFLVGPSRKGLWVVREEDGSTEGVFRTQRDAVRFALSEGGSAQTIRFISDTLDPSWYRPSANDNAAAAR